MNDSTWAWLSGNETRNSVGVYGEKGTSSPSNIPSGRSAALGWHDGSTQVIWLFGGYGYSSVPSTLLGYLSTTVLLILIFQL